MAASPRQHPPLFYRIFLGHLLVVLLCFVVAVLLLDYLFVERLSLYMQRTPLILVPVMLALIGIAGLSALWTAGSAALPLGRFTELLESDASPDALLAELDRARTEENADLLCALHGRLTRQAHRYRARPLYMQLDRHLNILAADADTAAQLGAVPGELARKNLRSFLHADCDAAPLLQGMSAPSAHFATGLTFRGAGGRPLQAHATLHAIGADRWLLLGNDLRRG
ncbi:MAG: hypothetical protein RRA94_16560 [Bacteroidota bacterium]|nr:hypothetical protein [Bacteroidota bacterium]